MWNCLVLNNNSVFMGGQGYTLNFAVLVFLNNLSSDDSKCFMNNR